MLLRGLLTSIFLVLGFCWGTSHAAAEDQSEWLLTQQHPDIGQYTVYVSHSAVKLKSTDRGLSILAKAPSWKVICYRPRERTFWDCDLDFFNNVILLNPTTSLKREPHVPVVVREAGDIRGNSKNLLLVQRTGTGTKNGVRHTEYEFADASKRLVFWVASDIQVSPKVAEVLSRLAAVPQMDKVPLYVRLNRRKVTSYSGQLDKTKNIPFASLDGATQDLRQGPQETLITKSCRKVPFRREDFEIPVGYKRVPDVLDISLSPKMKLDMTTVLDDVGFVGEGTRKVPQK